MKKYVHYVGIDVSKSTLDVAVLHANGQVVWEETIPNSSPSLKTTLKELSKSMEVELMQTLFCLEPTGHYSNLPVSVLLEQGLSVWSANPLDIRQSIGLQRGKSDKTDALRIAEYAFRFEDKARLVQTQDTDRQALQQLLTQRELLVKDRAKYAAQLSDYKGRIDILSYETISKVNERIISELDKSIEEIEQSLEQKLGEIPCMQHQCELLQTIPGVGKVLARTLVIFTNGFCRFSSPKALACHAGVAPFAYSSGSSIRGKSRVSHRANKRLKSLLHMAAMAAVRTNSDLKTYYERRVTEGKNKMCVLNAVRNKIILRAFAVVKKNQKYSLEAT